MPSERLTEYHRKATLEVREFRPHQALLPEMIEPKCIAPALPARTKASVLRELVNLARSSGRLNDAPSLIRSLEEREALCSTGMPGGFAVPHPRVPDPYLCESSVIVLGRTSHQIPFGAPDGRGTDLFFLICCQDDRLHLHTLARLCLMAQKTAVLETLRQAPDAESMHSSLLAAEQEVLAKLKA